MAWLKRHPFAVTATFDRVVALSFAFPEEILLPLVPQGLDLDTWQGLGFVTIALVWTRSLRPVGFPAALGQDFFLAGYRLFTRFQDASTGRHLRGLKILRSDTDKRRMVCLGNLMTGYRYGLVRTTLNARGEFVDIRTHSPAGGPPTLDLAFRSGTAGGAAAPLPPGSPFPDWRTARRFAGPMPFTFSPEADGSFVVIEGSRRNWSPRPVEIARWHATLFDEPPFAGTTPVLANAFTVENIPYRWSKGRILRPLVVP